jgi:hypothetical protein
MPIVPPPLQNRVADQPLLRPEASLAFTGEDRGATQLTGGNTSPARLRRQLDTGQRATREAASEAWETASTSPVFRGRFRPDLDRCSDPVLPGEGQGRFWAQKRLVSYPVLQRRRTDRHTNLSKAGYYIWVVPRSWGRVR